MTDMYPWQENILNQVMKGGIKPGEMTIMTSGRNVGKSYWSSQAIDRLMRDIMQQPISDLMLSEGTVYGSRYYTVEPVGGNWKEMETWAVQTYGETGSLWRETKNLTPEPLQRWYMNDRRFWFRDEKDRTMFILRWR